MSALRARFDIQVIPLSPESTQTATPVLIDGTREEQMHAVHMIEENGHEASSASQPLCGFCGLVSRCFGIEQRSGGYLDCYRCNDGYV